MIDQHVLIVDADADLCRQAQSILLRQNFKVWWCQGASDIVQYPFSMSPDIVLTRINWIDEIEALVSQQFRRKTNVQFIQLFRNQSADVVLSAFKRENSDCLPVPFSERTLLLAVARASERRELITRNERSKRRMKTARGQLEKNLKILQADQQAGRQMQQSLLPPTPVSYGDFRLAQKICPSLYLSGDFINYLWALDNHVLFYLMDVSGHGSSSAFVTVMIRQLMRRLVRRHIADRDQSALDRAPGGFLERINRVLMDNELEKFLTMFAGNINREKNTLRYSVGAQMPPPIMVADGVATFLPGKGKAIGIFGGAHWDVEEIELPEKFMLVAFSDGILEELPLTSYEQKKQYLLTKMATCPADIDAVLPHLGIDEVVELPDDIAVLMLSRGYE